MLPHSRPGLHQSKFVDAFLHLSPHRYLYCLGCMTILFFIPSIAVFNFSVVQEVPYEPKFYSLGQSMFWLLTTIKSKNCSMQELNLFHNQIYCVCMLVDKQ